GITLTHIVPTLFRLLTREIADSGGGEEALPDLEFALIAGEPLYGNDIIKWRQANGNRAELVNLYGPSETTLAKLFYRIKEKELAPTEIVQIGQPIPNTEVLIINNNKLCSVGETGEIYIKTLFMSKGYYNAPKLNEMFFVQNPLVSDGKDIVYKTGDQGKLMPDGNLRFEGRLDGQIKLYGNRIEIGEIEVVLRQHPQVREAAVAARQDAFGNTRLIGYVVPELGLKVTVESLRRFTADKLPDYMVPAVFVTLKELPLTHNEKIDRGALPDPDRRRPEMEQAYVFPSTSSERTLTEIWCHVLGLDRVGVHDNFFDLGGTSILAVRVISLVQDAFGIELPIVKLFQYPNISLLSKYLTQSQSDQPSYEKAQDRAQRRRAAFSRQKRSTN
ncbi:non-ribosomal peptide synthetase, partial [bacterium]|nr:non-ribosomal peptide synthetase [bacterium]